MNMLCARENAKLIIKDINVSDKRVRYRLYVLGFKKNAKVEIIRSLKNKIAVICKVGEKGLIISREILLDTEVEYCE
ncbi:MAG: ferrous iron transport protein A [Clostridia bacterium]|nr:ferrous iron transport protein A [Clostridia bacterium]